LLNTPLAPNATLITQLIHLMIDSQPHANIKGLTSFFTLFQPPSEFIN